MITVSANFQAVLDTGREAARDLFDVVEIYHHDYEPDANGFDPREAEKRWSVQNTQLIGEDVTRLIIQRGAAKKFLGKQFNSLTLTLSNVDRTLAAYLQQEEIEGKFCVLRVCSQANLGQLEDTLPWFIGQIEKPGEVDNARATLTVKQLLGSLDMEVPSRVFQIDDPEGRNPQDPLYEGFNFTPVSGQFLVHERVRRGGALGLLGLKKTQTRMATFTSLSGAPINAAIPVYFGRCNVETIAIAYLDLGASTNGSYCFTEGCEYGVESIESVTGRTRGFAQPNFVTLHYGLRGEANGPPHAHAPGAYFSGLSYVSCHVQGATFNTDDPAPQITAVGRWLKVDLPDGSGGFTSTGWTDNPAYIIRFVLKSAYWGNLPNAFIEDASFLAEGSFYNQAVSDITNAAQVMLPTNIQNRVGPEKPIRRFKPTGIIDARAARWELGIDTDKPPELRDANYQFHNPETNLPALVGYNQSFVKRYTFNGGLTERAKLVDWLHENLLPVCRGYLTTNQKGQLRLNTLKPVDSARLSASTTVGATSLPVEDVTVWRNNLTQQLLIGAHLATSEVRTPSAATFDATRQNAVTLAVSNVGTVTVAASGSTLSGGNSTTQAAGTVTIGGSPDAGDSVTVTLAGLSLTHQIQTEEDPDSGTIVLDTPETIAYLLSIAINAHFSLKRFLEASASGAVVTVKAKQGLITVSPALEQAHRGPLADPTAAPTLSATSGGSFAAGVYRVGYCWNRSGFRARLSPLASITLTANQRINVSAVTPPAGCTVDWFFSEIVNDEQVRFILNNNGAGFTQSNLPPTGNDLAPYENRTAEEIMRVAMSFADGLNASQLAAANLPYANMMNFKWPLGGRNSSVNQFRLRYRDARQDFAENTLIINDKPHQRKIKKINKLEVSLLGVDNVNQAERLGNQMLAGLREGSDSGSWTATPTAMILEEGDVVCVSDAGNGLRNIPLRLEEVGLNPNHSVACVGRRYSTEQHLDFAQRHAIPLPSILNEFPPAISALDLTATLQLTPSRDDVVAIIAGAVTFQHFHFPQLGRVFWKRPGASDYEFTGEVLFPEGEALQDSFTVANAAPGTHYFKVVTEALGGAAQTVDEATAYSVVVAAPALAMLQIADIPHWRESDSQRGDGVYMGACPSSAGAYFGARVYGDLDAEGIFIELGRLDTAATIGALSDDAGPPANVALIDESSILTVNLTHGSFQTVTEAEALAGANRLRVGNKIVHFIEAENTGGNTWELSRLIWGRHGTEDLAELGCEAGEAVMLLNEAVQFVPLPSALLEQSRTFYALSIGASEGDTVQVLATLLFIASLPLTIGNLTAGLDEFSEDWLIGWQGRSQFTYPPQLNRNYRVRVYDGADVVRLVKWNSSRAQPLKWLEVTPGATPPPHIYRSFERMSDSNSWLEYPVLPQIASTEQRIGYYDLFANTVLYELRYKFDSPPTPGVFVYVSGGVVTFYNPTIEAGHRTRIGIVDGHVHYWVDYVSGATIPIYIHPVPVTPNPNLRAYLYFDIFGLVLPDSIRAVTGYPRFRYPKNQQIEDFGAVIDELKIGAAETGANGRIGREIVKEF